MGVIVLKNLKILSKIKGGLIVSCQALSNEPLYSSYIMSRMAYAAELGGACGIRANTPEDITEIKKSVKLPVIGLYKQVFPDSEVYITPTEDAVDALMESQPDIIAIDATGRLRPYGSSLSDFFHKIRIKYPDMLFMGDCSTYEDALQAEKLGFDLVGTTLSGYTNETKGTKLPNFDLMKELSVNLSIPVIAEGGIWTPEQLKEAFRCGVHAAVIGTAITRPMDITRRFVNVINSKE
ncbi:putative N-acetylmannosamine-6-phosphate 2-epimerase [Anaerocolumna sedimenticola]|uniref:Putative N-acetylmannosamine-6-phosphate 2-epimerase n=1 Tax=Anaerocolumna sedimenticola TaxID=2696063 RepID=A0A6P1TMQ3_9FIRM|nr:N-acetylmannosamine-6-phosphate 2-epimerase [Anaerocolumna sedimenticola]QHQ61753.1 putative N-acetylmannosamine-6-phosphate 2-epimerase [Anaerocolumna sedimenticola]